MKKLVVLLLILVLTGCTKISDLNYDQIIETGLNKKVIKPNIKRKGYEYLCGSGQSVVFQNEYNDVIASENYKLYLYVDLISYFNKVDFNYEINNNIYYSKMINGNNKKGYIEVTEQENNKYLIEIMYNYAKIEVMVDNNNVKSALYDAVNILSSIKYNDNIIKSLMEQDVLSFTEEEFNIFETTSNENNVLLLFESESEAEEEVEDIPDTDLVN